MRVHVSFESQGGLFEADYEFSLPTVGVINRMVKQATSNPMSAQRAMLSSLVDKDDADRLTSDIERYPGIAVSIANRLLEAVGMTAEVTAKN